MHLQVLPVGLYIETEHTGPGPSELDVTKKESSGFTAERVESMLANFGPHDGSASHKDVACICPG